MNLGQLIGELRLRAELAEAGAGVEAPVVRKANKARRGERQKQVLELTWTRGAITLHDVTEALAVTPGNASVILYHMHRAGELVREGQHGNYRYRAAR